MVKITYLIVVGVNCLSSSRMGSSEWWRCQLSRTSQDYEEDWKHEDSVHGSKGQDNPLNSSWCKLLEVISYKELHMNDEGASCQELLFMIMKKTGSMKTVFMEVSVRNTQEDWKHEECAWTMKKTESMKMVCIYRVSFSAPPLIWLSPRPCIIWTGPP